MSTTSSLNTTNSALDYSNILTSISGSSTTGIDVNAAVQAALYAARAPERIWQQDVTTLTSQSTALSSIQTATQSLENDMDSLNTLTGVLASRTVSSSNGNLVSASAAAGTAAGVHQVVVSTLATKATWYSDLESSATTTLPTSSITITNAAGTSATFATGTGNPGDNLNDLVTAINGNTSLGVTASIISDAGGSRLVLASNTAGSANNFTVTAPNFTGTSWSAPTLESGQTLGAGSISFTTAAGTATINTTAGETYSQLATAINSATVNGVPLGLTATATTNANGTTSLSVSGNGSSFSVNQPAFGFTQSSSATDATGTIDGVPFDSTTDTVTGVIPGVTVNLTGTTGGSAVSLTVAPDVGQITTAINQFVTDYNTAINLVNAQFKVSTSTDSTGATTTSEGALASDPTIRSLQSDLGKALGYVYTPSSGTTTVSTLRDLGITMNPDGTLAVDATTLTSVATANASDVTNFFQGSALNGFANSLSTTLHGYTTLANGSFTLDMKSITSEISNRNQQISDFEDNYIASQQTILTAEFSKAESALQTMTQTMAQINSLLGFNSKSS